MPGTMDMLPLEIEITLPNLTGTADCRTFAIASDTNQYAIKTTTDNPHYPFAPFDELFGYELARHCNIAVPQYKFLRQADGTLAFGSAFEGGVVDNGMIAIKNSILNKKVTPELAQLYIRKISSIYALDLFQHNEDRHDGNYLIKQVLHTATIMAMDFGRSWNSLNCPINRKLQIVNPPQLPLIYRQTSHPDYNQPSNTLKTAALSWQPHMLGQLSGSAFFETLERIQDLNQRQLQAILDLAPEQWCDTARKRRITEWWHSNALKQRINIIKKGYIDGSLVQIRCAPHMP